MTEEEALWQLYLVFLPTNCSEDMIEPYQASNAYNEARTALAEWKERREHG